MQVYNPITQQVEPFVPRGTQASVYVCGVTPYDTTHLGHAFTYCVFDVLVRYLELQGLTVRYAQNVTDIDDDILRKAREVGEDWRALGNRWTAHFIRDMQALNVRPPDYYPRATEIIPEIVSVVARLIEKGVAYESGGSVYFHVDAWPDFGQLSHLPLNQMLSIANERGNNPDDPHKRDPLDFVLWQAQAPGEPAWDSPWGPGRPGWHIECSTMSHHYLGNPIDFHGGGGDLAFPHHECEIAQAEAATNQRPCVRFWMHAAMVYHAGEKMSKSLGNLVMVNDLLRTWSADAVRLYLAAHHYRQTWSHSEDELAAAERRANLLRAAVVARSGSGSALSAEGAMSAFIAALDDDLATPAALDVLERLAQDVLQAGEAGRDVRAAQEALRRLGAVFGLRLDASGPEERVLTGWGAHLKRFTG